MFDIGWIELVVIAALAIIVVGPKDLPRMMRVVGHYVGQARAMAREFQRSFDEMARESELEDLKKEMAELRSAKGMDRPREKLPETTNSIAEDRREPEAWEQAGAAPDLHLDDEAHDEGAAAPSEKDRFRPAPAERQDEVPEGDVPLEPKRAGQVP